MVNIREFNTKAYTFLKELRMDSTSLRYAYRKSNYGGRLDEGFWFYGNNEYICISFWSGMDWKNRTPNIAWYFMANGDCQLEINVSDSQRKMQFIQKYMLNELNLYQEGRRFVKRYGYEESAGLEYLDRFINNFNNELSDKNRIDEILERYGKDFFINIDNRIDFIDQYEFRSRDIKIKKYIEKLKGESIEFHKASSKPSKLSSVRIFDYGEIKEASILDIKPENQWIFLVGENGSGKTTVIRALATILGYKLLEKEELLSNPDFHAELILYKDNIKQRPYLREGNNDCNKQFPLVSSLAIFGPNRLISQKDKKGDTSENSLNLALKKKGLFDPLWNLEYRMLDIEKQFDEWERDKKKGKDDFEKRRYYITTVLTEIVPGLYDIRFEYQNTSRNIKKERRTIYIIKKDENSEEEIKDWRELPSGTKSVFAMVSEILIRLYHYQKDIVDPAEFRGIIIIDEIDLHLHPKAQRDLIKDLSKIFINVQFIVSTHSPIPLLGAPDGSVFVSVNRNYRDGIYLDRLIHLEKNIANLTPNILLSSEIFGDSEIYSENYKTDNEIFTEDKNSDILYNKELKDKLSEGLKPDQLEKLKNLIDPKNEV